MTPRIMKYCAKKSFDSLSRELKAKKKLPTFGVTDLQDDINYHLELVSRLGVFGQLSENFVIFPERKIAFYGKMVHYSEHSSSRSLRSVYTDTCGTTPEVARKHISAFLRERIGWCVLFYTSQYIEHHFGNGDSHCVAGMVLKTGKKEFGFVQYDPNPEYILRSQTRKVFKKLSKNGVVHLVQNPGGNEYNTCFLQTYNFICGIIDDPSQFRRYSAITFDLKSTKYSSERVTLPFWEKDGITLK